MVDQCVLKADIENLSVTNKAVEEIQHSSNHLSLRERQLLIMFIADKSFCESNTYMHEPYCNICESLVSKVDLASLVERGFLDLKPGATLHSASIPKPTEHSCKIVKSVADSYRSNSNFNDDDHKGDKEAEPEVFLRVASGNF